MIKQLYNRLYNDYLMPSRLKEYERVIVESLRHGYEHITVRDYLIKLQNKELGEQKYFIHRHDIDTDLRTTKKFFEIEKKHQVKTSYYFRLSTIDSNLMKLIDEYGSEASYHFEEIAQYCKDNHIKSKEEAVKNIQEIREIFSQNVITLEKKTGIKILSVAAHGDFVNKRIGLTNSLITEDKELRTTLGIIGESYDEELQDSFDSYISDVQYPVFYSPQSIFEVIGKEKVICLLTHPRNWKTNIWVNTKDNVKRFYEGIKW